MTEQKKQQQNRKLFSASSLHDDLKRAMLRSSAVKRRSFHIFRNVMITGVIVTVPILLSLWGAWYLYSLLTNWGLICADWLGVLSHLPPFWRTQIIRVLALVGIFAVLFVAGLLAKAALGQKLLSFTQYILLKLPFVNFIYSTCKQIGDAIWSSKKGNMFQQVVLFEYPRKGCYAIGFLTNENTEENSEIAKKLGKGDLVSVFMPTTPNPTSGFLMYVPRSECIMLEMTVSDAMRLIVSCGAILPESE